MDPLILNLNADTRPNPAIAAGVRRYLERHDLPWCVQDLRSSERWRSAVFGAAHAGPLAVCGLLRDTEIAACRQELGDRPAFYLSASGLCTDPQAMVVQVDDVAVGRQAVDHLAGKGYRQVACWGSWEIDPRATRFAAAARRCAELGLPCYRLAIPPGSPSARVGEDQIVADLAALPKPLAIFAHQDGDAVFLRSFCQAHRIRVPDEVGILGVDDEVDRCTATEPGLSSVRTPWQRIGEELAATLHRLVASQDPPSRCRTVPPYGVTARASTALGGHRSDDPLVRDFFRHLDTLRGLRMPIAELARMLCVSRATLHRRLVAVTGRGPQDHQLDRRIGRACELLRGTDEDLATIARRCGFNSPQRLHAAFTARLPVPPGVWRQG